MKVMINGAGGRIGRAVTYEIVSRMSKGNTSLELIALNEPRGIDAVVKSYKERDPVHGLYNWDVMKLADDTLGIHKGVPSIKPTPSEIKFYSEKEVSKIPFKKLGVDMVLECSGFYGDSKTQPIVNGGRQFLQQGVKRVIETYPAKTADASLIMGVNHELYDPKKHKIISNTSCTTKSLAVPLKVLIDSGVEIDALFMDSVHAATASQGILDSLNQILTHKTGAAKATGQVIPSLEGRMNGMAWRVPTLDGSFSCLNFVSLCDRELNADIVNNMLRVNVENPKYASRLGIYKGKEAGSYDIIGRRENAIVIPSKTMVLPLSLKSENGKKAYLIKIVSGYDNELGSSVDPVLLAEHVAEKE